MHGHGKKHNTINNHHHYPILKQSTKIVQSIKPCWRVVMWSILHEDGEKLECQLYVFFGWFHENLMQLSWTFSITTLDIGGSSSSALHQLLHFLFVSTFYCCQKKDKDKIKKGIKWSTWQEYHDCGTTGHVY